MIEVERRWFGAQVHDTVVTGKCPQIAHAICHHIVAESEYRIVLNLGLVIHINSGQSLNTATPHSMADRIFNQSVKRTEIGPTLVHLMHARCRLVFGMVQAHNTMLPGTNPQATATVHQHGLSGITRT